MKKLLGILVLSLLVITAPSFADDIQDFQIEGISIGDSLLDYFSKEYIQENKYFPAKKFTKFASIFYQKNLKNYEDLMINFKDKNYEIAAISAFIKIKNIEDCKIKKKKIVKSVSVLFLNAKRSEYTRPYFLDPNTLVYSTVWLLDEEGFVRVACYDWSKESENPKELRIDVANKEYKLFLDSVDE